MAHEDKLMDVMRAVRIANKHQLARTQTQWKKGASRTNNTKLNADKLADLGKIVKEKDYFRMPDCKSKFGKHAKSLTDTLIEFIKLPYETQIYREFTIEDIGLRPDALVFISNNGKGACAIVEQCNDETDDYLTSKINVWKQWGEATGYLSKLFGYWVRHFDIVVNGKSHKEAFTLKRYLEVLNG